MSKRSEVKAPGTPAAEQLATPVEGVRNFHTDFVAWLYKPHGECYDTNVAKFEQATQLKRENAAYGLLVIYAIYLIFGKGAQFLCNITGFAYPAYVSVKAIRTEETADDTQWLTYWTVFATFSLIDTTILTFVPVYWLLKVVFLVYLYLPQTNGARLVYVKVIDPLVTFIDKKSA